MRRTDRTPASRRVFADARAPRSRRSTRWTCRASAFIRNRLRVGPRVQAAIDALYRKRLQSLQAVDDAVARLVDTLRASGQLENTFIVFASDNGFHLGQHRMPTGKQTAYDEDIRVPLIVRGPGVPAGRTVGHLAGNVDLAPTFAELGGAETPAFVDGRSLVALLKGALPPATPWRQAYLVEHWPQQRATADDSLREPSDADQAAPRPRRAQRGRAARALLRGGGARIAPDALPGFHALRTARYAYVEYVTGERELYDLAHDPFELNNLAATASQALLGALSGQLRELVACAAATCRMVETKRVDGAR